MSPAKPDAGAFQAGDILLRARIMGAMPYDQHTRIDGIGGEIDVPAMILPDIDISYFVTDHWAIEGQTGVLRNDITIHRSAYGDIPVGKVWSLPLSVTAEYHPLQDARLSPYLAAGVLINWFFGEEPAGGYVDHFKVSTRYGAVLRAGMDYRLDDRWFANAEVRQLFLPEQTIENRGMTAKTSLKLLSFGLGIGFRF
nr:OmpW family outer membrane protein [Rhizobium sp. SSA_523]